MPSDSWTSRRTPLSRQLRRVGVTLATAALAAAGLATPGETIPAYAVT